ncbi:uncharacterized protein LOC127881625 [Dreissena polymorpha]|uniref:Uncharacterized protein n=1 Tax=Dreissena polymorpha TaxID=45954 RepID=A0A9D4JTV8_DREPO|nr:uncharacterized protein LOC127881625 [Dreissena polymorpha]XP_052285651.1 uncharacterized protein LOC127881625 [Dreissena polymorpha]XP_052285652.1 uncharacterized protein LOC127881625 [Dreissena polymorpha]XP_052285653.1 uncharacterized protein LOC127881625 [Dreissena polymorpha]KAH3820042.1 hypothetical protein DPMN_121786 [Dreissena polymorpha]
MTAIDAARSITFSVDLSTQCQNHLLFLRAVDNATALRSDANLQRALYRYEHFWLPLAVEHPDETLSAPLDIEWMWHCHLLSPRTYIDDCTSVVGMVVNHTLKNKQDFRMSQEISKKYWNTKYPGEPFHPNYSTKFDVKLKDNFVSKITYDIIAAAKRQGVFYYQVSLPHYSDETFLDSAILRYKQFLYLRTKLDKAFITPCFDQDLVWHSHQLNPRAYADDTTRIVGYVFNHDDSTNDRSEGSELVVCHKNTADHWLELYGEPFASYGAMYRGYPSIGYFTNVPVGKRGSGPLNVSIDKINVWVKGDCGSTDGFQLAILAVGGNRKPKLLATLIIDSRETTLSNCLTWTDICDLKVEHSGEIRVQLKQKTGKRFIIFGDAYSLLEESTLDLEVDGNDLRQDIHLGTFLVRVAATVKPELPTSEIMHLVLHSGNFVKATVPETVRRSWGPMALERLPSTKPNDCREAMHSFRSPDGSDDFKVRVLHSAPLTLSCIQVLHKDKIAAFACLTHVDQLPLPTQVSTDIPSLNPRQGQRAVTVKSNQSDWCIVTGKWVQNQLEDTGSISLNCFYLKSGECEKRVVFYDRNKIPETLKLMSVEIDLHKGSLRLQPANGDIAENIALAMAVAVLHVLCVPRPENTPEGTQFSSFLGDVAMVRAAGLYTDTPNNQFVESLFGEQCAALCGGGKLDCSSRWNELPTSD